MARPRPAYPRPRQQTSQELLDGLCQFVRQKFYPEHPVNFAKDRPRLLEWVILYPAAWLNRRGVTLPPERYHALLTGILLDTVRFGQPSKVTYLPAYLRQVLQSHFEHHGEAIYEEAKSLRTVLEHTLFSVGRSVAVAAPDPVRDLARAATLLRAKKPAKKSPLKSGVTPQLNLF